MTTSEETSKVEVQKLSTRKDLQIPRRLFHMANGSVIASLYWMTFSHEQALHILGTVACLLYVTEQLRINYPEISQKLLPFTKFIMRTEEQLKESAMVPYMFAVLLTIITFPKVIAIVAIYTLAIADPLSAIIGIKFGKRKIVPHKTVEGSFAFFLATFSISLIVLGQTNSISTFALIGISLALALFAAAFEMLPIKLDDNLTIPLFTSFMLWFLCLLFGINLGGI